MSMVHFAVIASDNTEVPVDSLAKTIALNADNTTNYIEVTHKGVTYRQTFTYSGGYVTAISRWTAQ